MVGAGPDGAAMTEPLQGPYKVRPDVLSPDAVTPAGSACRAFSARAPAVSEKCQVAGRVRSADG